MKDTKIIKTIELGMCPHCGKEIVVASAMTAPVIDWMLKKEDVAKSKQNVRDQVFASDLKDKQSILGWLDQEETIIGPSDVQIVLKQLFGEKEIG